MYIQKFFIVFRNYGLKEALIRSIIRGSRISIRIIGKIYKKFAYLFKYKRILQETSFQYKNKCVYIFLNSIDWNYYLHQRPHQLAKAVKSLEAKAIYITPKIKDDKFSCIEKIDDTVLLYDIDYLKYINLLTRSAKEIVLISTTTANHKLRKHINYNYYAFDYIDDFSVWPNLTNKEIELMKSEMKEADLLIATATELFKEAKCYNNNVILCSNAVEYDHFSNTDKNKIKRDFKEIVQGRNVIGYYGAFSTWFDYELLYKVASEKKEWLFVLIGSKFDKCLDDSHLLKLNNIIYIGEVKYDLLPNYASYFNISIIPFLINDITKATSPVKLFEYMALGHPIVTSNMDECANYKSVIRYEDYIDFEEKVEAILNFTEEEEREYKKILKKEALENTWEIRIKQINEGIGNINGK